MKEEIFKALREYEVNYQFDIMYEIAINGKHYGGLHTIQDVHDLMRIMGIKKKELTFESELNTYWTNALKMAEVSMELTTPIQKAIELYKKHTANLINADELSEWIDKNSDSNKTIQVYRVQNKILDMRLKK